MRATIAPSSPLICLLVLFGIIKATEGDSDVQSYPSTITSQYCIIGGGSSGTYAAVRLQQLGRTVTLIEKESRLGGHVNTYSDPVTGDSFDYGVITFDNISVVTDYFDYLDVPLAPLTYSSATIFIDFANGSIVPDASLPQGNSTAAFIKYIDLVDDEYSYLPNGFNLPSPVPEDLLMTWGDFLEKYDLGDLAFTAFTFLEGVGNILAQPTLYILKYLAKVTVENILGENTFLSTAHQSNQELYNKALAKLGTNALISSNVTHVARDEDGVNVFVSSPVGRKLVHCSKLLIAIPPTIDNLKFLDLHLEEEALFGQFNHSYYWDGVIRNSGIPDSVSLQNVDLAAPYAIPPMPGIYAISSAGLPNLATVYHTSPYTLSDEEVKAEILATTARLVKSLGYPQANGTMELVGFNNHAPFELTVSTDSVRNGFYTKMNELQGKRNTFWTGAAWQAQDSSQIWNWTEHTLLPQLLL
ncbi:related to amine oxidase, flavin-containing superfamily [Phialocephala subalpina]|uniref:Related to amine oxidase, flavin-containing superfamily n=1 Tax=Phialocephala subalpina TaxID=576137 RepID=A0A1L7WSB7_9HELO|nr:related to amine oxidase, flavin-containing superfamily [Phialocephala subalpina]